MHTKIGQTFHTETNGNSTKPLLVADRVTYEPRYSLTDEPDDMGRWARKAIYRGLHIAWISRLESNGVVKFHVNTHFPLTKNDYPSKFELCDSFEDAKMITETLWTQFLSVCH